MSWVGRINSSSYFPRKFDIGSRRIRKKMSIYFQNIQTHKSSLVQALSRTDQDIPTYESNSGNQEIFQGTSRKLSAPKNQKIPSDRRS